MKDFFLGEYPLLRFSFGFCDEFEGEAIGVVVILERVLESDEFCVVPSEEIDVGEEHSFVLFETATELLLFEIDLPLKLLE